MNEKSKNIEEGQAELMAKLSNIVTEIYNNPDDKKKLMDIMAEHDPLAIDAKTKEKWDIKLLTFLNETENKYFEISMAKILLHITETLEARYPDHVKHDKFMRVETPIGSFQLLRIDDFVTLEFSGIKLAQEILGQDIKFPLTTAPFILENIASNNQTQVECNDSTYTLNSTLGNIQLKTAINGCTVIFSSKPMLKDFFQRIHINLQNH